MAHTILLYKIEDNRLLLNADYRSRTYFGHLRTCINSKHFCVSLVYKMQ